MGVFVCVCQRRQVVEKDQENSSMQLLLLWLGSVRSDHLVLLPVVAGTHCCRCSLVRVSYAYAACYCGSVHWPLVVMDHCTSTLLVRCDTHKTLTV